MGFSPGTNGIVKRETISTNVTRVLQPRHGNCLLVVADLFNNSRGVVVTGRNIAFGRKRANPIIYSPNAAGTLISTKVADERLACLKGMVARSITVHPNERRKDLVEDTNPEEGKKYEFVWPGKDR